MPAVPYAPAPLPLHIKFHQHVTRHEPALWQWFSGYQSQAAEDEAAKLDLLKSSYQLTAQSHASVVNAAQEAATQLGLNMPVRLYQAYGGDGPNASVRLLSGEAQIVFSGNLLELLSEAELTAVLAHELAHLKLWAKDEGAYFTLHRLLMRVAAEDPYGDVWEASASHYARATEIYADLGALAVCGDMRPVVAGLVKSLTGLKTVDADSYLAQTAEIFAKGEVIGEGYTHPEIYIRTRALQLAVEQPADWQATVEKLITGPAVLASLNLLARHQLAMASFALLHRIFACKPLQTERLLSHARRYFADYAPDAALPDGCPDVARYFREAGSEIQDYASALLLDFASADPALEDVATAALWLLADACGVAKSFESRLTKDLKYKKAEVQKLKTEAAGMVEKAAGSAT